MPPSVDAERLLNSYLIRMRFWVRLQVPATNKSRACSDAGPFSFCQASSGLAAALSYVVYVTSQ
jgi:hypothetical protein